MLLRKLSSLAVIFLLVAGVFYFVAPVHANGGGVYNTGVFAHATAATACVITPATSQGAGSAVFHNDYLVVFSFSLGTSITVSSITDGSGDVFVKQAGHYAYNNLTEFTTQYTGATGNPPITITYSSSVVNACMVNVVSGLSSGTADQIVTSSATAAANNIAAVIASTTLTANDVCFANYGFDASAGVVTATADSALSSLFVQDFHTTGAVAAELSLTEMFNNVWPASTATTAAFTQTKTGATTMRYDGIVSCFPAVKTTVTSTTTTTSTSPTTTTTTTTTYSSTSSTTTTTTSTTTTSTTTTLTGASTTTTTSTTTSTTTTFTGTTTTTTTTTSYSTTTTTTTTPTTTTVAAATLTSTIAVVFAGGGLGFDLITVLVLMAVMAGLDVAGLKWKASLLSDMAGLAGLFSLAWLVYDASINGVNGTSYQVFVVLLVILTTTSFLITMGLGRARKRASSDW